MIHTNLMKLMLMSMVKSCKTAIILMLIINPQRHWNEKQKMMMFLNYSYRSVLFLDTLYILNKHEIWRVRIVELQRKIYVRHMKILN